MDNRGHPALGLTHTIPDAATETIQQQFETLGKKEPDRTRAIVLYGPEEAATDLLAKDFIRQYFRDYAYGIYWLPLMRYAGTEPAPWRAAAALKDLKTLERSLEKKKNTSPATQPDHKKEALIVIDGTRGGPMLELLLGLTEILTSISEVDILILETADLKPKYKNTLDKVVESKWALVLQEVKALDEHQVFLRLASVLGKRDRIIQPGPPLRNAFTQLIRNTRNSRRLLPVIERHLSEKVDLDEEALTAELNRINLELEALSLVRWIQSSVEPRNYDPEKDKDNDPNKDYDSLQLAIRVNGALQQMAADLPSSDRESISQTIARDIATKAMDEPGGVLGQLPAEWILFNDQPALKTPGAQFVIYFLKCFFAELFNEPLCDKELLTLLEKLSQSYLLNLNSQEETLEALKKSGLLRRYPPLDLSLQNSDEALWQLNPIYLNPL